MSATTTLDKKRKGLKLALLQKFTNKPQLAFCVITMLAKLKWLPADNKYK